MTPGFESKRISFAFFLAPFAISLSLPARIANSCGSLAQPCLHDTISRMRSWLVAFILLSSLLFVGSAMLWVRSCRAYDQLNGTMSGYFELNSYSGRLSFTRQVHYALRAGVDPQTDILHAFRPSRFLNSQPEETSPLCIERSRFPLGDSSGFCDGVLLFPGLQAHHWLAPSRAGTDIYSWCTLITVPYWLLCLLFGLPPVFAIAHVVTRVGAVRRNMNPQSPGFPVLERSPCSQL